MVLKIVEHPKTVADVLVNARARYHADRLESRPSLLDPTSYVGLFLMSESRILAMSSAWPLTPAQIDFIRGESGWCLRERKKMEAHRKRMGRV